MGRRVSDGKSFNAAAPSGQVISDYDLYRIGGWNGCAIGAKDSSQTDRTLAFDADSDAIFEIKLPAGLSPAVGDYAYWTTQDATTFQRGDTHLIAAASAANGQEPAFHFTTTKNSAGYAKGRIMQGTTNKFGS